LVIHDGYDNTSEPLGIYCGDATPGDVTGSGNVLYVTLRTDKSVTAKGFHVRFSGKQKIDPNSGGNENGNRFIL
jgi:hypothetical protein